MDGATEALVKMGWARVFGLGDDVFTRSACRVGLASPAVVMTVRLWDHEVICAPSPVLARAVELAERDHLTTEAMMSLAGPRGRLLGQADLAYTGRAVEQDHTLVVKNELTAAGEIERECTPDEVAEAGLGTMDHLFVAVDPEQRPAAGAGYQIQANILAHMGVLVAPLYRHTGLARRVATVALNHAIGRGLVAQWRSRAGHNESVGLGARLGCETIGRQVTVLISSV